MKSPKRTWPAILAAILAMTAVVALAVYLLLPPAEPAADPSALPSQTVSGSSSMEALPTTEAPVQTQVSTERLTEVPTEAQTTEAPTEAPTTEPLPEPTPTDVSEGPGDVHTKAYQSGTVYITEGCGYGGYWFGETNSARYCEAVNRVAKALEGQAQVYCLICPLSSGVLLAQEVREDLGLSDQNKAMAWMYERMDPLVRCVPVYGALKRHNDENIYFHTDHHWTALGAWYAYREFCAQKGIRPHAPEDFETYVYENYQGSFLNYSNGSQELKDNPDTLVAYVPQGTNTMTTYIEEDGGYSKLTWPIVKDVSDYSRSSYYMSFVSGDRPWSYAHNETITDGSSVLVVKDSYGNAFIPWLIDHYEHIYWIDYRAYQRWCPWAGVEDPSISDFVTRNDIQDVILCNNIGSTGSGSNLNDMEAIFR